MQSFEALKRPGQYLLTKSAGEGFDGMLFVCPCGLRNCRGDGAGDQPLVGHLDFGSGTERDRECWSWDGNEEAPTLRPSVQRSDPGGCRWHGYLTAGEWRSV